MGYGGNIAVSTGPDGTLLLDDEYGALAPKVHAVLAELRSSPVKVVVNTHWHDDHTGGNDAFARGLSEDEVVALHPTEGFARASGGTDRWVRIVYREYHR